jgi:hypothetical protein
MSDLQPTPVDLPRRYLTIRMEKFAAVGLLGYTAANLLVLLQLPALSTALTINLYLLSVAIPLLASYVFMRECTDACNQTFTYTTPANVAFTYGSVAGFSTIPCIVWHFSWPAALLFVAVSMVMIFFSYSHIMVLEGRQFVRAGQGEGDNYVPSTGFPYYWHRARLIVCHFKEAIAGWLARVRRK